MKQPASGRRAQWEPLSLLGNSENREKKLEKLAQELSTVKRGTKKVSQTEFQPLQYLAVADISCPG